jgi:transcriptional regulator with XRE-family HTH domain
MSKPKWIEDYFRNQLRDQREQKHWKQEDLADKLSAKGIPMHWTTVAKIEKGSRSVRIDEAAAIADLFGISVDAMLGRRARPRADQGHALTVAADTAIRSSDALINVMSAVRDRINDLSAFESLPARDKLIVGYERAYGLLVDADGALTGVAQTARKAIGDQLRRAR